ncbi:hypothetical protein DOY81_009218 [Sarcophaga bullata]|nr:hypothetical protein DOY81_009218 [Sarcophaga bullata]
MARILQFTKNHWKKLGLTAVPVLYGANYIKDEYKIYNHMRYICNVVHQNPSSKAANVLVILNPMANGKGCEKMFKKYCEPVLHMAGYSVDVIKTKYVGHAKSVMETLTQLPDVVVVAGGDGTSSEVVTGLLRRNTEICPILFLPLGVKNKTVSKFVPQEYEGKVELVKYLSNIVLALIHEHVKSFPVVKYEIIPSDSQTAEVHKPIFGLQGLSWGVLSNIEISKEKYWYFGALKYQAAVIMSAMRNKFSENISATLMCTPPCPGCRKCLIPVKTKRHSKFANVFKLRENMQPTEKEICFDNKTCGTETLYNVEAKQIDIVCSKNRDSFFELNTNVIENISNQTMFLTNMLKETKLQSTVLYKGNTIKLLPQEAENQTYYIDGEGFEARPIKISFLPNAIKCYC